VSAATCEIVVATGVKVNWETIHIPPAEEAQAGEVLGKELRESLERTRVALKGPITTPIAEGRPSINVALRKAFELYANVRPIRNLPGVRATHPDIDLIIIRENTEGEYSGIEHEVVPGVVESLKIITDRASTRVARFAFELARHQGRKKIAAVHKANIMKMSDGLFLRCSRRVAAEYPEIEYKEVIVDNACMQLVMKPQQFDVLLLENLYGDIVSDLCAGLVGGLGVVPGANLGDSCAVFEAVHGTAPDIVGKQLANPTAMTLSAVMMLRHLGETAAADKLERAIHQVYAQGKHLTRDVGGSATTGEFTRAVLARIG
jgi:isocitrate dehydrogenase (NAD+)